MTYQQTIVSRFTRPDGHVAWQAVAAALGCTVEKAKVDCVVVKKAGPEEILSRPMVKRR